MHPPRWFPGLVLAALLAPSAGAQSLLAMDNGSPVSTSSMVNEFSYRCSPMGRCPTQGLFGPAIASPYGGIAYNWLDRTIWATDGLLLVQMDEDCNVLQRCSTNASATTRWTGLAIDPLRNLLVYTTASNDILSVAASCPLNRSTFLCSLGSALSTLTGIELDPVDGSLWVCDDAGRVSNLTGSTPSGGCLVRVSFPARCASMNPVLPFQGLTLDRLREELFLTDSGNNLVVLDLAGNPLRCCALPSTGSRIFQVGLSRRPERTRATGRGCSATPCASCAPILRETSDAHLPNPHFALRVSAGPQGGGAFFLFSPGGGNVSVPSLCGPFQIDLVPPPVTLGPLTLSSPSGLPCSGEATLSIPIPLDPTLYGGTVYSQVFGLCVTPVGLGHFLSDGLAVMLS